jgi:hypothetical protein
LLHTARLAVTREWWDEGCSGLDLVTSLETLDEAGKGDRGMAACRLEMLDGIRLLPMTDQAVELAGILVSRGIVPGKAASDAVHIALASVHAID